MFGCERCSFFVAVWLVRVLEKKNSRLANFASSSASRCILFSVAFALESARELWLANASLRSIFCMRMCVCLLAAPGSYRLLPKIIDFSLPAWVSVACTDNVCTLLRVYSRAFACVKSTGELFQKVFACSAAGRGFYSLSLAYVPWVLCSLSESCCVMVRSLDSICCFLFHERQTK